MANQALVKRINKARILNAVREHSPLSRSGLADLLELDRKSITNIVSELLVDGYVVEAGTVRTGRGRPLIMLRLDDEAHWVIGLSVHADAVDGVLLDVGGSRRGAFSQSLHSDCTLSSVLAAIRTVYTQLRQTAGDRLQTVGVAVPGILDVSRGIVIQSVNLAALEGVHLHEALGSLISEPLVLEEESRAKALAEKWFGVAQRSSSFVCVDLGIGIGAGLVQNRRLYTPPSGYAGEIGHIIIEHGGRRCRCGHAGCLEAYASEPAILAQIEQRTGRTYSSLAHLGRPDEATREVLRDSAYRLGLGLSYLANIVCPPMIVLNGTLMRYRDMLMADIERGLSEGALPACRERVQLACSTIETSDAVGAGARALAELYEVEDHFYI